MNKQKCILQLQEIVDLGRSGFIGEMDIEALEFAIRELTQDDDMEVGNA